MPPQAASADSLPRFGQYRILRSIASGGMGEIFLAKRVGPGGFEKLVALKKMLPHLIRDERSVAMFLNEAKLAAQLNHANIVQIYDFGRLGDSYFISMEFVHGKNLRDILDRTQRLSVPIPLEHALGIVRETCTGLAYAHHKAGYDGNPLDIIHRDVSPQNILVSFEGEVKITDFGIAKASLVQSETTVGTVKGKLSYMSPEQISGETLDRRSDLFSLGVILFELLTGRKLFPDDVSLPETIERIQKVDIPLPRDLVPTLPEEVEGLVLKALARIRSDRFQTAREMELAITEVMSGAGVFSGPHERTTFLRELFTDGGDAASLSLDLGDPGLRPAALTPVPIQVTNTPGPLPGSRPASLGRFLVQVAALIALFVGGGVLVRRYSPESLLPPNRPAPGSPSNPVLNPVPGVSQPTPRPAASPQSSGAPQAVQARTSARVAVTSIPSGAEIWVDGLDVGRSTPAEIDLAFGPRKVRLEKDGYDSELADVALSATNPEGQLHLSLQAKPVTVQVATDPVGATVRFGEQEFTSPHTLTLKPGRYQVAVEKAGYQSEEKTAVVEAARTNVLRYELKRASRTGLVSLNCEPWAMVYEAGKKEPIGQTPLIGYRTDAGLHRFRFVNPQMGLDETVPIEVPADDHLRKLVTFEGSLVVDESVRELWVNGRSEARRELKLPIGSYNLRVKFADGRDSSMSVRIRHGEEVHVP